MLIPLAWIGRFPLLTTVSCTRSRPLLITIRSSLTTTAPGACFLEYSATSTGGKRSSVGTGRNEPYSAASRFPSSVQIGSCTVTRKTLSSLCDERAGSVEESRDSAPVYESPLYLN